MLNHLSRLEQNKPLSHHYRQYSTQVGFTLVELIITIAIMAIMAAIATPSMSRQISQTKTRQAANAFEMAVKDARAQALITQNDVTLSIDATNKRIMLSSTVNGNSKDNIYQLDNSVNITQLAGAPNSMRVTAHKGVYQNTSNDKMTENMGYGLCVNQGLIKAIIKVTGNANVTTEEVTVGRSCS